MHEAPDNLHGLQTLYDLLGVKRTAGPDELRAAYHAKARQYHPDLHQNNPLADLAADKLRKINHAYEVLSDPNRRAAYDGELEGGVKPGAGLPKGTKWLLLIVGVLMLPRLAGLLLRQLPRLLARPWLGTAVLCLTVYFLWRWAGQRKGA